MVECVWVRVRGKTNKADIMVGISYGPLNQDEEIDKKYSTNNQKSHNR